MTSASSLVLETWLVLAIGEAAHSIESIGTHSKRGASLIISPSVVPHVLRLLPEVATGEDVRLASFSASSSPESCDHSEDSDGRCRNHS